MRLKTNVDDAMLIMLETINDQVSADDDQENLIKDVEAGLNNEETINIQGDKQLNTTAMNDLIKKERKIEKMNSVKRELAESLNGEISGFESFEGDNLSKRVRIL